MRSRSRQRSCEHTSLGSRRGVGSRRVDAGTSALAEYSDSFEYRARVERAKISDVRRKDEGALALCNEHD